MTAKAKLAIAREYARRAKVAKRNYVIAHGFRVLGKGAAERFVDPAGVWSSGLGLYEAWRLARYLATRDNG